MIKKLFDEITDNLKLIPEIRGKSEYDFCKFNNLIIRCNKNTKVADGLKKILNIDDLINNYKNKKTEISKQLLNYTHETQSIFLCYDIKTYNAETDYQKQLTIYRMILR